jgi:hypothetical protein
MFLFFSLVGVARVLCPIHFSAAPHHLHATQHKPAAGPQLVDDPRHRLALLGPWSLLVELEAHTPNNDRNDRLADDEDVCEERKIHALTHSLYHTRQQQHPHQERHVSLRRRRRRRRVSGDWVAMAAWGGGRQPCFYLSPRARHACSHRVHTHTHTPSSSIAPPHCTHAPHHTRARAHTATDPAGATTTGAVAVATVAAAAGACVGES